MECHECLFILTTIEKQDDARIFDEMLDKCLLKVQQHASSHQDQSKLASYDGENPGHIREQYIRTLLFFLESVGKCERLRDKNDLTAKQFQSIKTGIEIAISMVIPCLLPEIGNYVKRLCPRATGKFSENLTDIQKYERLSAVARTILNLFDDTDTRPAVTSHLLPLLAITLQLSAAPLVKPCGDDAISKTNDSESTKFIMSNDLYSRLKEEQLSFESRLTSLINASSPSRVIEALMIIHGHAGNRKWLRRETQKLLIDKIMQPCGITGLVQSICQDSIDSGVHWRAMDIIAKLIATPQGSDPAVYYESVCSQLLELISWSDTNARVIANHCIATMYDQNSEIVVEKFLNRIIEPFIIVPKKCVATIVVASEAEVTKCMEILNNCFTVNSSKFKSLPIKILVPIVIPLFHLYNKARGTVYAHQTTVQKLLLLLLSEESMQSKLFSAILNPRNSENDKIFGNRLTFAFGPNGQLEITQPYENIPLEILGDSLLELVNTDSKLAYSFFCYLLQSVLSLHDELSIQRCDNSSAVSDETHEMESMENKLVRLKLLSIMAETSSIQETQIKNPEHILLFVQSLMKERLRYRNSNSSKADTDIDALYISLMLIKVMLTNNRKLVNWKLFDELVVPLKEAINSLDEEPELVKIAKEVANLIKTRGASDRPFYTDLSEESQRTSEFDNAIKDLANPLLPVRAHGLMTLAKLIERLDAEAVAKKDIILCIFLENLEHEDSFIYLTAINGMATLAKFHPQRVIETLVREFSDVTYRRKESKISPDTRAKIGEILMKTTRSLGDLAPVYKNLLINGFLCGTRDDDPLVRASSLSCLGELCKVLNYRLGTLIPEILLCIGCIIRTDKAPECRRAGVLVAKMLLQGLGKDALTTLGNDLVPLYQALRNLWNNDEDPILRLHAQLALDELDDIARDFLFGTPKLGRNTYVPNQLI